MHDYCYRRGYTIYPGKGAREATFRIATIGAITSRDIERFLAVLQATSPLRASRSSEREPQ